jgi:hypothetical protein
MDRRHIMAKLDQLEQWAAQLAEYQRSSCDDLRNARDHLAMLGDMMDINAHRAIAEHPERSSPLVAYLEARRASGA